MSALSSERHHGSKATDVSPSASNREQHNQTTKKPSATASFSNSKKAADSNTSKSKDAPIATTGPNGQTLRTKSSSHRFNLPFSHSDGSVAHKPTGYIPSKVHKWYSSELSNTRKIFPQIHVTGNWSESGQAHSFTYDDHSVKGIQLCSKNHPAGKCAYGSVFVGTSEYHPKTDHPMTASELGNGHEDGQRSSTAADATANTHSSEHSSSSDNTASHSKPDRSNTEDSTSSNTHGRNSDSTYRTPDSSSLSSFSNSVWHTGKHGEDLKPGETTRTGTPSGKGKEPSLTMSISAWWNTYKKHPRYTNAGVDPSYTYQAFSVTYKGTTGLQDKNAVKTGYEQPSETGDGSEHEDGSKSTKGSSGRRHKFRNRRIKRSAPNTKG